MGPLTEASASAHQIQPAGASGGLDLAIYCPTDGEFTMSCSRWLYVPSTCGCPIQQSTLKATWSPCTSARKPGRNTWPGPQDVTPDHSFWCGFVGGSIRRPR